MSKFHINDKGEPGKCSAQTGNCPFGEESEHFGSADDARKAYEKFMSGSTWLPPKLHAYNEAHTARIEAEKKFETDVEIMKTNAAATPGDHSKLAADGYKVQDLMMKEAARYAELHPDGEVELARLTWKAAEVQLLAALQHIGGVSKELQDAPTPDARRRVEVRWDMLQEEYYKHEETSEKLRREYFNKRWAADDAEAKADREARDIS